MLQGAAAEAEMAFAAVIAYVDGAMAGMYTGDVRVECARGRETMAGSAILDSGRQSAAVAVGAGRSYTSHTVQGCAVTAVAGIEIGG